METLGPLMEYPHQDFGLDFLNAARYLPRTL